MVDAVGFADVQLEEVPRLAVQQRERRLEALAQHQVEVGQQVVLVPVGRARVDVESVADAAQERAEGARVDDLLEVAARAGAISTPRTGRGRPGAGTFTTMVALPARRARPTGSGRPASCRRQENVIPGGTASTGRTPWRPGSSRSCTLAQTTDETGGDGGHAAQPPSATAARDCGKAPSGTWRARKKGGTPSRLRRTRADPRGAAREKVRTPCAPADSRLILRKKSSGLM